MEVEILVLPPGPEFHQNLKSALGEGDLRQAQNRLGLLVGGSLRSMEVEVHDHPDVAISVLRRRHRLPAPDRCQPRAALGQLPFLLGLPLELEPDLLQPFRAVGIEQPVPVLEVQGIAEEGAEHRRGMVAGDLLAETELRELAGIEPSLFLPEQVPQLLDGDAGHELLAPGDLLLEGSKELGATLTEIEWSFIHPEYSLTRNIRLPIVFREHLEASVPDLQADGAQEPLFVEKLHHGSGLDLPLHAGPSLI